MDHKRFTKGDHSLLGSRNASLENQEIIFDDTVVWEAAHWCDALLGDVRFCGSVGFIAATADPINFFVELRTVVITVYKNHLNQVRITKKTTTYFDQHEQRKT